MRTIHASVLFLGSRTLQQPSLRLFHGLQLSAALLLLWSCCSCAQPLSPQLALTTSMPNITLHNYTLYGQTLYTACPCKDMWQFKLQNGTLLELSGCANPENDTAGPFCEIDPRATRCPSSETLSMNTTGRGRRLVVPCLPERRKTIAGCLCSSFWSEKDGINFTKQWPILPRDQLQQGLHEGWLLAGNCSAALQLPGGARCTVVEGSCSSMPAKAYPPPNPDIFWQITSADNQGWDFCGDPTYDSERAAQPNSIAELLAKFPANVQATAQLQTQAGCTCSPGNWTYHPQQVDNADTTPQAYLGCSNPDNDPLGDWCPVDPVSCPSHYGAKQPAQPGDVPRDMWFTRVYFDYCGTIRNKTEAGCLCLGNWKPTFNSTLESQPNANGNGIRPEPATITVFSGGVCGNPDQLKRERNWCFVDYNTCGRQPAGKADKTNELHWDYCPPTVAAVTPAAAQSAETGIYLPTAQHAAAAASPASQPGLYLPSVPAPTAAPPAQKYNQTAPTAPAGNVSSPQVPAASAANKTNEPPTNVTGQAVPAAQQQQPPPNSGSSTATIVGAVVGCVVGALLLAAVIGLLLLRRRKHHKKQTSLQWADRHLPDLPYGGNGDVELGGRAGGRGVAGYQVWDAGNGVSDKLLGVTKVPGQQQHGTGPPSRMQYTGHVQYNSNAGLGEQLAANPIHVGADITQQTAAGGAGALPGAPAAAVAAAAGVSDAAGGSSLDAFGPHSYASSTQGSHVPLMGHKGYVSSSTDGHFMAAAAAGGEVSSDGGSGSGLPNYGKIDNPAEAVRQSNVAAAAAAAAAEQRAASLAALWDSAVDQQPAAATEAAPPPVVAHPTVAAVGLAAPVMHQQQQQQQGVLQPHAAQVARMISSPFASKGSAVLAALESTPPVIDEVEPNPHNQGKQQQQQHLFNVLGVSVPSRTITPSAPKTPSRKEDNNRFIPTAAAAAVGGVTAAAAGAGAGAGSSGSKRGNHVSWLMRSATPVTDKSPPGSDDDGGGDYDSQLSGLTGMITDRGGVSAAPKSPDSGGAASGSGGRSGATAAAGALGMCRSVAPPATRHMSGPMIDNNWDFDRANDKPVRVLLQVTDEADVVHPVTLLLLVSAPPPRPEVMATIVLPKDPPQAGVDLAMDANTDLAFPSNSFIGQGAFGQVHRALLRGRHPVAVKMLTDPDLRAADPDTLRSFREELMIMAKLDHPHILRCYGGNLEVVNPFIVTELCECSLDKMISHYRRKTGSGLPLKHTLTIGLHIASALWHLHPSIVHRDLKPQNVLLTINGTAKVADFGLSRMKTHTFVSTRHVEAGTAAYMAPECFGNSGVGEKVDIYALGMLLWECITGVRPWKGCNMVQIAFQVAMQGNRPELPAADSSRCPAELSQLLADCWAANPKERPSSGEVMKALAHLIRMYVPEQ